MDEYPATWMDPVRPGDFYFQLSLKLPSQLPPRVSKSVKCKTAALWWNLNHNKLVIGLIPTTPRDLFLGTVGLTFLVPLFQA
jgi:hypothetical protein